MIVQSSTRRRGGSTLAEAALVLSVFILFLMGIFEYGRFLMITHVATNAARSGVRYATVNVDKPDNFDTTPTTINGVTYLSISDYTKSQMGGVQNMIQNIVVTTYPVDPAQMYSDPPVITAKTGTPAPTWKQATFTERIAVQVSGEYRPIVPGFIFFYTGGSNSVPITVQALSGGEG